MTEMVKGQCQLELQAIERNSRIIQKISVEDIKSFKEVEFCEEMRVYSKFTFIKTSSSEHIG